MVWYGSGWQHVPVPPRCKGALPPKSQAQLSPVLKALSPGSQPVVGGDAKTLSH